MDKYKMSETGKKGCFLGKKKAIVIAVLIPLGIVLAITGTFFQGIYRDQVKQQLVLKKGSEAYNNWYTPPSPVYMRYYVFNYTNIADIIAHHATPRVSQVGPYTYREIRINEVTDYNEYNITYVQNYSYVFEPNMSCAGCKESDLVFVPNIAFLTVLRDIYDAVKDAWWIVSTALNLFLNHMSGVSLFKKLTVGQVIWGYEDRLLRLLGSLEYILNAFGFKLPNIEVIALQHNGTANANEIGNLTILTGKENINDVQRIVRWRGLDKSPYWNTKYGDMINGTDGTHAPPFVSYDEKWYVFVPQLCRSIYFEYQEDASIEDIPLYRYSTNPKLFSGDPLVNPDNVAFCNDTEICRDGLLPISKCQPGGAPIFMSSPHFYQGDPDLVERIEGLHPDPNLHGNILDVEPITGVTMRAYKRLQINIMGRKSFIEVSQPFQHDVNFLPILMIEEAAVIDPATAEKFKKMVMFPKSVLKYTHYLLLVVGTAMVILAFILTYQLVIKHYKDQYAVLGDNVYSTERGNPYGEEKEPAYELKEV